MAKRTGYLGANLHQGTGLRLWETINEESRLYNDHTVFVLPGGRLDYRRDDEHLRNTIFRYATSENLDGAVVWGSTLAGAVSWGDVASWTKELSQRIPVVSLGIDVPGVPSISYDAYTGVYQMIDHFIMVHGYRRIAFLSGPENHDSAASRFEAYRDCLRDHHIEYDPSLVSSPRAWGEGMDSIREIVETNRRLPKKDFDAVYASSDMMGYMASRYLEEHGYHVPDDIAVAGFNDSPEAFLPSTELTTVRLPVKDMVEQSFRTIREMESKPEGIYSSLSLPTVSVYRRSCGCMESYGSEKMAGEITSYEEFEKWINIRMSSGENAQAFLSIVRMIFRDGDVVSQTSRRRFDELCWRYLKHGGTMKFFFSALKLARRFFPQRSISMEEMELLHEIMMENVVKVNAVQSFRSRDINNAHNEFTNRLLGIHSYVELSEAMKDYFPRMGIDKAFLFVYPEDGKARLESGFSSDKLFTEGMEFSSDLLFPPELDYEIQRGLFVVEPLFYDSSVDGYIILKNRDCPASMLENIRTDISSSMQAIYLYSVACEKSQKAEEAEKQSNDFYAHISEELKEPLDRIKAVLSDRKERDCGDLLSTIIKTEHLLELTAVEKGGVTLEKSFIPLGKLLDKVREKGIKVVSPSPLPSVVFDRSSVDEIVSCIIAYYGDDVSLTVTLLSDSVSLHFTGSSFVRIPSSTPTLQYVEKLLLMQGARFSFQSGSLDVFLAYPSLSGETPAQGGSGVLFISDDESGLPRSISAPVTFMSYEDVIHEINSISSFQAIAWDVKRVSKQSGIAMNLLRNHKEARSLNFICFGMEEESISVNAAVEGTIPTEGKGCIYSFGPFPKTLSILREFAAVEEVRDTADIKDGQSSPLFIFYEVDSARIDAIRKDRRFTRTPVLIIRDRFRAEEVEALSSTPNVLIVNTAITEAEGFVNRIVAVFGGEELLPPLTSILVKRAICYLNDNATYSISRWQIAGSVNISEDYLTRIFRKEIGISPWDYLNRYRIQIASRLLLETGSSISEIASLTGFQDQAYFCRVFRKVKGFPPGNIRTR